MLDEQKLLKWVDSNIAANQLSQGGVALQALRDAVKAGTFSTPMTDTVNKQALLSELSANANALYAQGHELPAEILIAVSDAIKSGRFDSAPPTTPVQGYREALEWYADAATYTETLEASKSSMFTNIDFYTTVDAPIKLDRGERARQALSQTDIQPLEFYIVRNAQKDILYAGIDWDQVEAFLALDAHNEYLSYGINSTEDDQPGPSDER